MKRQFLTTGVTRMYDGFVCVSGLDLEYKKFIRPLIKYPERPGIKKDYLFADDGIPVIKPLVINELDFIKPDPKSAFHTEDWIIDGNTPPRLVKTPTADEIRRILAPSVESSFNKEKILIDQNRSILLVRCKEIIEMPVTLQSKKIKCRVSFVDAEGKEHFRLPVTDANFLAYAKYLWKRNREYTEKTLIEQLQGKETLIRIGITRLYNNKNHFQVSGIFTFPDWLNGNCYADFEYDFSDYV